MQLDRYTLRQLMIRKLNETIRQFKSDFKMVKQLFSQTASYLYLYKQITKWLDSYIVRHLKSWIVVMLNCYTWMWHLISQRLVGQLTLDNKYATLDG